MLASANREYDQQVDLADYAVRDADRLATRGTLVVSRSIQLHQAAAAELALSGLGAILEEQGLSTAAVATVAPTAMLTHPGEVSRRLVQVANHQAFQTLVRTLVQDAHRTTRAVDAATRPAVNAHVRSLRPPSCGRCAVLAGRVYRYSQGFDRHPGDDCLMTPTSSKLAHELVTKPDLNQIKDLSKADVEAITLGADISQVVNVKSKKAGLQVGSSVAVRAGRLTPFRCLELAGSRAEAIELLTKFGYITP